MSSAAIIAAGSEMLGTARVDTNSLKVTAALEDFGVELVRKSIVGDDLRALTGEIRFALAQSDILITSGGLGPTEDDLTREALAEALGLTLERDPAIVERLQARFAARGWTMPEVNTRQANVFPGQTTLTNERGTAPGFHLLHEGKHIWVFPGVPHELEWMIETYLKPWLEELSGGRSRYRRVLKISGMTESGVEEKLAPFYAAHRGEPLTILASPSGIELHLQASGEEADAKATIAGREAELLALFGDRVFGFDDDTLESALGRLLIARGETVATAESCTGGLVASRITDVAGSSAYFMGGAVCYTARLKTELAGVDPELIRLHGEVSEEVAIAMARGIRERLGTTYGIGVTGIAGPGGGSEAKPVGTVHVAVSDAYYHEHRKLFWPASRTIVKWFSS
ncbi:MAG: competence/damage-inducible protein CinA C-terminal domain protein, partial [Acidobacteria bacterium]|nr:competence/damage-inducible protein CinA C-terminal domain protein [Acidobacteriota bacterium]